MLGSFSATSRYVLARSTIRSSVEFLNLLYFILRYKRNPFIRSVHLAEILIWKELSSLAGFWVIHVMYHIRDDSIARNV